MIITEATTTMNFSINDQAINDDTHLIELSGEVDLYTAPDLKERLLSIIREGKNKILIDLSETTFIDSTTLGVLIGAIKRLRPGGGNVVLVCQDDSIRKVFEITGLDKIFSIYEDRQEALKQLG